jgi:hypothetical protein
MFSFIKKYTESLAGVDLYGDIALVLFVIVFTGVLIVTLSANKEYISGLSRLPLNDSNKD